MKIYDISQEVFGCQVYPGDPMPEKKELKSMEKGEVYNLTAFSMCAHNGTHIDAPCHFIKDGKPVDEMSLEAFIGMAYVVEHSGVVTDNDATEMIEKAKGAKTEHELRELAKSEGIDITSDEAAIYFEQLHSNFGELKDSELDGVSGGGCGKNLPLYRNYSMVQDFFCVNCFSLYPASQCKVMHYEKQDDVAYCPTCQGEVYPSEEFLHGKV